MPQSDHTNPFADMWTKVGEALTTQQKAMMGDAAARMALPGFMNIPWQAFVVTSPNLQSSAETFQKLMTAWKDLPASFQNASGGAKDPITVELLQKIFDAREWLNVFGMVDETARFLAQGPKFADIGQVEGKFTALMTAWAELRAVSIEYQTHMLGAWTRAATEIATKLNEAARNLTPIGSRSDLVALWVDIANRHQLEEQSTPAFLETQRKLLRASTTLRLAQQDLADYFAEIFGLPTRPEIDDLTKTVSELRREVRAQRRARRRQQAKSGIDAEEGS
jgi:polyhydroxyalkanoate synthase subunit PhaE